MLGASRRPNVWDVVLVLFTLASEILAHVIRHHQWVVPQAGIEQVLFLHIDSWFAVPATALILSVPVFSGLIRWQGWPLAAVGLATTGQYVLEWVQQYGGPIWAPAPVLKWHVVAYLANLNGTYDPRDLVTIVCTGVVTTFIVVQSHRVHQMRGLVPHPSERRDHRWETCRP